MEKPREIAVRILRRYAEQEDYLENLLDRELSEAALAPADRGLVQELTFGVGRWQATLDWLIAQKTAGRSQKTLLQILLRLGLYQIFWLERIPDHAAVHETVEMAKRLGFSAQAGFINALLRGYLREQAETENKLEDLKLHQPALGYSHPDWLVARWQQRWGDEKLRRLLEWNNTPPPTYARLNTLKTTSEKLAAQWETEGVQFATRQWDWTGEGLVFELKAHPPFATLPSFREGLFYVQDPSTLLATQALNAQSGQRILDLCAAPGGKTTFIAQQMQNLGHILAHEVSPARLKLVKENCARLGVTCVEPSLVLPAISHFEPRNHGGGGVRPSPGAAMSEISTAWDEAQARRPSHAPAPEDRRTPHLDAALVDAPCSNTGVMRRRVDLRWRIRPEEIERLRRGQLALLARASGQLKRGGTLVYSTCSLEPDENEGVIKDFLAAHPDFRLAEERTLLPFVEGVDGAYVARLITSP